MTGFLASHSFVRLLCIALIVVGGIVVSRGDSLSRVIVSRAQFLAWASGEGSPSDSPAIQAVFLNARAAVVAGERVEITVVIR